MAPLAEETAYHSPSEVIDVDAVPHLKHHMALWARQRNKMELQFAKLRSAKETPKSSSRMRDLRDALALIASQMHAARLEIEAAEDPSDRRLRV